MELTHSSCEEELVKGCTWSPISFPFMISQDIEKTSMCLLYICAQPSVPHTFKLYEQYLFTVASN